MVNALKFWLCLLFVAQSSVAFLGQNKRSHSCPVVFVLSEGVTPDNDTVLERGFSIGGKFRDPWVDDTGAGTLIYKQIKSRFSKCVSVYPVKWEYSTNIQPVEDFTTQLCKRKHRSFMCVIFSKWVGLPRMSLPVVTSVSALARMVEDVKVEVNVAKDGTKLKTYKFARHK
jgi:hypothetical protein